MYKTRSSIKRVVALYRNTLKQLGVNVDKVILYGSFARGEQKKYSDIDLIVISNDFKKMNLRERLEVLGVAAVRIREPIEAKGYTSKEIKDINPDNFLKEIFDTGFVI